MIALATIWYYTFAALLGVMLALIVACILLGMWSVGLAAWDMWRDRQGRAI